MSTPAIKASGKAPPQVVLASLGATMIILGFTGSFVVKLLEMGYDLPSAFCAAAAAGAIATEIAYRLLGHATPFHPRNGGQPPHFA